MFVENVIPKWSSTNSLTASLRVQQILYQLSPTCVCPNFSGMVQELQHHRSITNATNCDKGSSRPRHLIALALETSRSTSFDIRMVIPLNKRKVLYRKHMRPRLMSEDLTVSREKMNDIELLFQQSSKGNRSLTRYSMPYRKESRDARNSIHYRNLAEGSVKLAMSCWSAGHRNIPKIRIHEDNMDNTRQFVQLSSIKRSNSLSYIELETFEESEKIRSLSEEAIQVPSSSNIDGVSYSSADFDKLRASVYSIHGSTKSGSVSPSALVALPNTKLIQASLKSHRRCSSLSDINRDFESIKQKHSYLLILSDSNLSSLNTESMADLFETANVLGQALEMHLKQQTSS